MTARKKPQPQRPRKGESDAAFCRRMKWRVGTRLGHHPGTAQFRITAIGEQRVLGVWYDGGQECELHAKFGRWLRFSPARKGKR